MSFIAILQGERLPANAKRLYPITEVINADGTTRLRHNFSVQKIQTGAYKLSFAGEGEGNIRAFTAGALNGISFGPQLSLYATGNPSYGLHTIE